MGETVDLNSRRPPVLYTVNIAHHYDGTIEFEIKDVADDERSREAVLHAFRRISGADQRIETLEAALRQVVGILDDPTGGQHVADMRSAASVARAALEGKDE